jgi:hypothetical protein
LWHCTGSNGAATTSSLFASPDSSESVCEEAPWLPVDVEHAAIDSTKKRAIKDLASFDMVLPYYFQLVMDSLAPHQQERLNPAPIPAESMHRSA